jgi:hypothetical protein
MPRTLVHRSGAVTDLAALHDALGCAAMAAVQAFRGDEDAASLSLTEAHAAAEEAFGSGSPGVDALNVVFAAIAQAAAPPADHVNNRPAEVREHHGRPRNHSRYHERGTSQ